MARRWIISLALALACGQLQASVTLSAITNSSVTATIAPDAADIGNSVKVWMGAVYQGTLYLRNGTSWAQYAGGNLPVAIEAQTLSNATTVAVVSQFDVSALPGLEIYVGYGSSEADMLGTPGKLAKIHTVSTVRDTAFGKVQGTYDSSSSAFAWLGIPFAQPPVGSLRWLAPADPLAWASPLLTQQFGNACLQLGSPNGPPPTGQAFGLSLRDTFTSIVGSEDCLTLNIWGPASGETNLPVLVYIYGGSHVRGWSGTPDYAGARLAAEQKIVFVSVNYRLNALGYLSHGALKTGDADGDSGNFAILDLIQALKFVKANIASFGGDPNNVTIAGQSAGAQNVWSLIVSPRAARLFHKAVALSAGQLGMTTADAATFATNLLRQLLIDDGSAADSAAADQLLATMTNAQIKSYLYGKSAEALISAANKPTPAATFAKVIYDGVVQPPSASAVFTGSYLNNVPVLSGITNDEGKYWGYDYLSTGITLAQLWTYRWNFNPDNPDATPTRIGDIVAAQYLPANKTFVSCGNTGYNGYTLNASYPATICSNGSFNTTYWWSWQANTLDKYRRLQPRTYAYNFSWAQQPEPWKTLYGAAHVTDVAFLFGNFGPGLFSSGYSGANQPGREALSALMRASLSAFMRTGDPNHAALGTAWLTWSSASGQAKRLILDADGSAARISMSSATSPTPIE